MSEPELNVKKIKNGTVIDHIRAGYALSVVKMLGITKDTIYPLAIAMNVTSPTINSVKDIIKIENRELKEQEVNKLALIAPRATINIIRDYEVSKKTNVHLPSKIVGIIKCINPACITNTNEPMKTSFTVVSVDPVTLRCDYCKKDTDENAILLQV